MNLTPDMYETIQGNFADMKFALPLPDKTENELYEMDILDLEQELVEKMKENYRIITEKKTKEFVDSFSRKLYLFLLDSAWQDHMVAIDEFKKGIHLKAYGQTDPIMAFKMESFEMFDEMMNGIREEILKTFMGIYTAEMEEPTIVIKVDNADDKEALSKEIEAVVESINKNGGTDIKDIIELSDKYSKKK
jgi:preprotein translocase subunit SecA